MTKLTINYLKYEIEGSSTVSGSGQLKKSVCFLYYIESYKHTLEVATTKDGFSADHELGYTTFT